MKDDILEQIGKYKAPKQTPEIAKFALAIYEDAGSQMTDEGIAMLRARIDPLKQDLKALTDANLGLVTFGIYLRDHCQDAEGSERIAELIRETGPTYQPIGERIVAALQDLAISAKSLLSRFSDRENTEASAPKFGEKAKTGTTPLKDLKPVGELSPARRDVEKSKTDPTKS